MKKLAELERAVRRLLALPDELQRELEALRRDARALATETKPARYPVTVLVLGESFEDSAAQSREYGRAEGSPGTVRERFASQTVWMVDGADVVIRFQFARVIAKGAWVIVLGGARLTRISVGASLCGIGLDPTSAQVARTDQPISPGVELFCGLHCGELPR